MDLKCTDYTHHSNPLSSPLSWIFFNKFFVRPAVADAQATIKKHGSTAEEIEQAKKICQQLDQNINFSESCYMKAGKLVETACDLHFLENRPSEMACEYAYQEFLKYEPRNWDDGSDKLRMDLIADEVSDVTEVAIEGLKAVFSGRNDEITSQNPYVDYVKGLELKYFTIPDYLDCVDLKTKWSKPNAKYKSGVEKGSLPSRLNSQYVLSNLYQFAGFKMMTGKSPIALYANKSEYRVFSKDTCDEMKDDFLDDVIADLKKRLKAIELQIKAVPNKFWLLAMNPADLNDYVWKSKPPGVIQFYKNTMKLVEYEIETKPTEFERVQNEFTIRP
tara:strand:- start:3949 stop:4944 length:996 start_codon:yes stop_codon:yes gene_type:complete